MPKNQLPARALPPTNTPLWLPKLLEWEQAPYDGIKGCPPDWLPEPVKKEFYGERVSLVILVYDGKARYEEIRERFDYVIESRHGMIASALLRDNKPYIDVLHSLARIYKAVQLGPDEGLRKLAGDDAVRGSRVRDGYKSRSTYLAKATVEETGKKLWSANPLLTIKDIIASPEITKLPGKDKTKREWLSKIDPRPSSSKQGRPRQSK